MHRKNFKVYTVILTTGLLAGTLVGELLARFLPDGVAKGFFTTSLNGVFGPLSIDLAAVALTLGPLTISVNIMSLVGVASAAYLYRAFF